MKLHCILTIAGIAAAASTGFSQTSIPLANPTFNTPAVSSGGYSAGPGFLNGAAPAGWTVATTGNPIIDVNHYNPTPTPAAGQDATQTFEIQMNGDIPAVGSVNLYQSAGSFVTGYEYTLTADAGLFSGDTGLTGASFYIANSSGTILASEPITVLFAGSYSQFSVPFTSTGQLGDTGPITVGLSVPSQSPPGNAFLEIDNFALSYVAPVPEPSSIAIAGLGGFGLLGLRRRRRA